MNWCCEYCEEKGICKQPGNIRFNKICGINAGLPACEPPEPQKIYAITRGVYSEYHICAITTNPQRAEELKKFYTDNHNYDETNIEIFYDGSPEVDTKNLRPIYTVSCTKNGRVNWSIDKWVNHEFENSFYLNEDFYFTSSIDAPDEEHALKIAEDMRTKLVAERLGL